jgi:hypothetical protein
MQDPDLDPKLPSKSDPEQKKSFRIDNTGYIIDGLAVFSGNGSGIGRIPRGGRGDLFLPNLIDGLAVFSGNGSGTGRIP